ncbi:MAG: hypothetical protein AAF621_05405 [Pseudomonadota bacterium]
MKFLYSLIFLLILGCEQSDQRNGSVDEENIIGFTLSDKTILIEDEGAQRSDRLILNAFKKEGIRRKIFIEGFESKFDKIDLSQAGINGHELVLSHDKSKNYAKITRNKRFITELVIDNSGKLSYDNFIFADNGASIGGRFDLVEDPMQTNSEAYFLPFPQNKQTISFIGRRGIIVKLTNGVTDQGDKFKNISNVIGSRQDDILIGDVKTNILEGHEGHDKIYGHKGADIIRFSAEDISIYGGKEGDKKGDKAPDRFILSRLSNVKSKYKYIISDFENDIDKIDFTRVGVREDQITLKTKDNITIIYINTDKFKLSFGVRTTDGAFVTMSDILYLNHS